MNEEQLYQQFLNNGGSGSFEEFLILKNQLLVDSSDDVKKKESTVSSTEIQPALPSVTEGDQSLSEDLDPVNIQMQGVQIPQSQVQNTQEQSLGINASQPDYISSVQDTNYLLDLNSPKTLSLSESETSEDTNISNSLTDKVDISTVNLIQPSSPLIEDGPSIDSIRDYVEFKPLLNYTKATEIGSDIADIIGQPVMPVEEWNKQVAQFQNQGIIEVVDNGKDYVTTPEGRLVYKIVDDNYLKQINDGIDTINRQRKSEAEQKNVEVARFNFGENSNDEPLTPEQTYIRKLSQFGYIPTNEEREQFTSEDYRNEFLAKVEADNISKEQGISFQEAYNSVRSKYFIDNTTKTDAAQNFYSNVLLPAMANESRSENTFSSGNGKFAEGDQQEYDYYNRFFSNPDNVKKFGEFLVKEGKTNMSTIRENDFARQDSRKKLFDEYQNYEYQKKLTDYNFNKEAVQSSVNRIAQLQRSGDQASLAREINNYRNLSTNLNSKSFELEKGLNESESINNVFTRYNQRQKDREEFYLRKENDDLSTKAQNFLAQIPLGITESIKSTVTGIGRIANSVIPSDNLKDFLDIVSEQEITIGNARISPISERVKIYNGSDGNSYENRNGIIYKVDKDGKLTKPVTLPELTFKENRTDFKSSGIAFMTAKFGADILLTQGVGKGINSLGVKYTDALAKSSLISQTLGAENSIARGASNFANVLRNPTNATVSGWYVQMYNDNYLMAEQGGIKTAAGKHMYAAAESFIQSIIQRINPDTNFLKSINSEKNAIVSALMNNNLEKGKLLFGELSKKMAGNVVRETGEEIVQQVTQDFNNTIINKLADKNLKISDTGDYKDVIVGTIIPSALASLLGGAGSRNATLNGQKVNLDDYSRNELITELARDENGLQLMKDFEDDAYFKSQKDFAQTITQEIQTRQKYIDKIPNNENHTTKAVSEAIPLLQKIESKQKELKSNDGTFSARIENEISDLQSRVNLILDNDLNEQSQKQPQQQSAPEAIQEQVSESVEQTVDSVQEEASPVNNQYSLENMQTLPFISEGSKDLFDNSMELLRNVDWNNKENVKSSVSKILNLIANKDIPESKIDQFLESKEKFINSKDYYTPDYLEKYLNLTLRDFSNIEKTESVPINGVQSTLNNLQNNNNQNTTTFNYDVEENSDDVTTDVRVQENSASNDTEINESEISKSNLNTLLNLQNETTQRTDTTNDGTVGDGIDILQQEEQTGTENTQNIQPSIEPVTSEADVEIKLNINQRLVTNNVIATIDPIELPDGTEGFKVSINDQEGNPVLDKNEDYQFEFGDMEDVEKFINQKQKGYILQKNNQKQKVTDEVINGVDQENNIGKNVTFSFLGDDYSGTIIEGSKGPLIVAEDGTKYNPSSKQVTEVKDDQGNMVQFQTSSDSGNYLSIEDFVNFIDKLKVPFKKAFGNVDVLFDWNEFVNKAKSSNIDLSIIQDINEKPNIAGIKYMSSKETVYGAKLPDGTIYIDNSRMNYNTPIHEFSHLWEQLMPPRFKKGVEILKQTKTGKEIFNKLKEEGNYGQDENIIWNEALNTHIGNYGEWSMLRPKGKMGELLQWVKDFFAKMGQTLGIAINPTTELRLFTDEVLGDLLSEKTILSESSQIKIQDLKYSLFSKSDFDKNGNIKSEILAEIELEKQKIIDKAKADNTYLKAPNGKNSNLTENQWTEVRTKRFKNWFGNWESDSKNSSKALDENGEPKIVHHIGEKKMEFYTPSFKGDSDNDYGIYFAGSMEAVLDYGETWQYENEFIHSVYLNFKNPFIIDISSIRPGDKFTEHFDDYQNERYQNENIGWEGDLYLKILKFAQTNGYDGAIMKNTLDPSILQDTYIAFDPNQIKSSEFNSGLFSKNSNNIQFSIKNGNELLPVQTVTDVVSEIQNNGIESGLKKLQNSDWFKGLTQDEQLRINSNNLVSELIGTEQERQQVVENSTNERIRLSEEKKQNEIKDIKQTFRDKISEMKKEYSDLKSKFENLSNAKERISEKIFWRKKASNAIKSLLTDKSIKDKITPSETASLIGKADKIMNARDVNKAFDEFQSALDVIIDKAEKRSQSNKVNSEREFEKYNSIKDRVQELINDNISLDEILKFDTSPDWIKYAEKAYFRVKNESIDPKKAAESVSQLNKEEQDLINRKTPFLQRLKKWREAISKNTFDRQWLPKKYLSEIGAVNTENRLVNMAGSASRGKLVFERAYDKIFKGLSKSDRSVLDNIIQQRRIITIDNNREERNLVPVDHPKSMDKFTAMAYLQDRKDELGDKKYNDLIRRSDNYFSEFNKLLTDMKNEGLINQESYDSMNGLDYQPRMFLEHLLDYDQNLSSEEKRFRSETSGLSSELIRSLDEGSTGILLSNAELLLATAIGSRYKVIMMNRVNREFINEEFPKAKQRFESIAPDKVNDYEDNISKGRGAKTNEERFYRYFKELNKKIIDNPITGVNNNQNPTYLYDKTPQGYKKAYYFVNGVRNEFFIEEELHQMWHDTNKGIDADLKDKIGTFSGSQIIKAFATGYNPAFVIVNTPRDFLHAINFSSEYSSFIPKAVLQLSKDTVIGLKEIYSHNRGNDSLMAKYIGYGGGMDFLNTQGMLKDNSWKDKIINNLVEPKQKELMNTILKYVSLKNISNYSEVGFRIAVFKRAIDNEIKRIQKTEPNIKSIGDLEKQRQDYVYDYAVRQARDLMDFNQGGIWSKNMEAVVPYFNAGVQGTRVIAQQFKRKPYETTMKVLQTSVLGVSSVIALSMVALSKIRDDEDDKESTTAKYLDFRESLSPYQKANFFNIPTGYNKDSKTYTMVSVAKSQGLTPMFTLTEDLIENTMRSSVGKKEKDWKTIYSNVGFAFTNNVDPTAFSGIFTNGEGLKDVPEAGGKIIAKNPAVKSMLTYLTGYDFFFDQPLQGTDTNALHKFEGANSSKVEGFYKELGLKSGLSPVRTKAFVESFVTSPATNPFVGIMYGGLDVMATDKTLNDGIQGFAGYENGKFKLNKVPVINRAIRETTEYSRQLNIAKEVKTSEAFQESLEKDELMKNLSDKISKRYENMSEARKEKEKILVEIKEFSKDQNTQERMLKRIQRKIQNKNIDQRVWDVAYSTGTSNRAKAILIYSYFGDVRGNKKVQSDLKSGRVWSKAVKDEYLKVINEKK
ncbi:hypothetical protein ACMGDK_11390 [Chryseobacterium sp. DT-3]|uniref:ADP-ribosyltransferase-containing protein n=1 Tax=Chryseobacterium sp. DT-3 TaxID=3396164 RepID=UPI003F1D99A3